MRRLAVVLVFAVAATLTGCGNGVVDEEQWQTPLPTLDAANLTVEGLYARFAEAIDRPGSIYRVTIDVDHKSGLISAEINRRLWVDVDRELVREESDGEMSSEGETLHQEWRTITANGGQYSHPNEQPEGESRSDTKVEARTCHGASAAVSAVLGCPLWREESTTVLEFGEYKGRHAAILVTRGTRHDEFGATIFTERLYLNAGTLMPVALVGEGDTDYGEFRHGNWHYKYRSDFVSTDSLPDDFFEPASIGYVEPDPEAPLNADLRMTVYWLGKNLQGSGGLPPLALKEARVADPSKGPGYSVTLDYRLSDDEFGAQVLTLQEWGIDQWNDPKVHHGWNRPCWEQKNIAIPFGYATVFMGFEDESNVPDPAAPGDESVCPSRPYDRFFAYAYLGSTVAIVDAPATAGGGQPVEDSPYDTLEGIEAALRGLQPRQ